MIKYKLICKKCKFSFDSWFASSFEYEKLKKKKFLSCHSCNSKKVEKTLMAPKVLSKNNEDILNVKNLKFIEVDKRIKEYQKFIKKNFDYVGENFTYEARSIHYNKRRKKKGIFGSASNDQIKELKEEGIKIDTIPWIEDKKN
tara:strand:- start:3704 stop:4132 length:429 start_codon:yes stop_codon:yes gene_type:complete